MQNKKQVYINLIVKDLVKSTSFYEAIGCTKNSMFSSDAASAMVWSEEISFMLLTEKFALNFNDNKEIADQRKTVSAFYALSLESKEAVDNFCKKAEGAGGRVYVNKFNQDMASDFMYTFEVEDPDGYILEPAFMDLSKFPKN
jgi:uncharacterized protein